MPSSGGWQMASDRGRKPSRAPKAGLTRRQQTVAVVVALALLFMLGPPGVALAVLVASGAVLVLAARRRLVRGRPGFRRHGADGDMRPVSLPLRHDAEDPGTGDPGPALPRSKRGAKWAELERDMGAGGFRALDGLGEANRLRHDAVMRQRSVDG